ncbi:hypothetical protein ACC723_38230, partial [Rhizobium ruizarguesonis]
MATPLVVSEVLKSFTMHLRDGIKLPVVSDVAFSVSSGECVVHGARIGGGEIDDASVVADEDLAGVDG